MSAPGAPDISTRLVYHASPHEFAGGAVRCAALVTKVAGDAVVELVVFPLGGESVRRSGIPSAAAWAAAGSDPSGAYWDIAP